MDRRKHSPIWSFFDVIDFEKKIARCYECTQLMSYRGTISNLKNHLLKKHPSINFNLHSKQIKSFSKSNNFVSVSYNKSGDEDNFEDIVVTNIEIPVSQPQPCTSQIHCHTIGPSEQNNISQTSIASSIPKKIGVNKKKRIDKHLLELFTQDFQPFSVVEDSGFKAFVKALNPSYELPSRKLISNNFIPAAYEQSKLDVMNKFEDIKSVCLTTDCWSSSTNDSYLALTAHFITENFVLESVLLDCVPIEGSHTSKYLAEIIKKITDSYGISENILIVITDNGANIVGAINELNWKHFSCYAHTLNLIVHHALEKMKGLQDKARQIVAFFKRSNLARERIIQYQKDAGSKLPKKLIQDVPTRWNATFYMLERLVLLQDAVKSSLALSDRHELNLSSEEWKKCSELVDVLAPFESTTRQMSGEGFVTGSQIIVLTAGLANVCSLLMERSYHEDVSETVQELQKGMQTRFKNIEYSNIVGICSFLDPRFKLHIFSSDSAKESIKDIVTKLVEAEYNKINTLFTDLVEKEPPEKKEKETNELSAWSFFDGLIQSQPQRNELSAWSFMDKLIQSQPQRNSTSPAILEIQRYTEENIINRKDNPFKWWRENSHHYPNLTKVFKRHFAMVATSVPCERVFTKAGQLTNDRRTRLKPTKVQQLMFLKENSKNNI